MDPISLFMGSVLLGIGASVSGLAAGIGQRLAAKFLLTNADIYTEKFYISSIEQQRAQMESAENRFVRQLQDRREEVLLTFGHQTELQRHGYEQARWPFLVNPGALVAHSKAVEGRKLNVIVAVQQPSYQTRDPAKPFDPEFEPGRKLVSLVTAAVEDRIISRGTKDIVFYNETSRVIPDSGVGLVTNTWNFIKTEPTMLLRVTPHSASRFLVDITIWGVGFSEAEPISAVNRLRLDLGAGVTTLSPQEQTAALHRALLVTLSIGIVGLSDAFQATHYPHRDPMPLFPTLIEEARELRMPDADLTHVCAAYVAAIEGVARTSPLLAADLAAKAALNLKDQAALAAELLDKALLFFKAAEVDDPPASLSQAYQMLRGKPFFGEGQPPRDSSDLIQKILKHYKHHVAR